MTGHHGDPHAIVGSGYDRIAERYADASEEARADATYFRAFLDRCLRSIPAGGTILDLGCGAGLISAELARRGRVIGVDLSSEQLRLARARVPAASFVLADLSELEVRNGAVDAIAVFWSVIHVRRERHAALFARMRTWLRPGGVLFGTLGSGDNPAERDDDFLGAPMYWSHFDAETNRRLLREAGFEVEEADVAEDMDEHHLWVIARA